MMQNGSEVAATCNGGDHYSGTSANNSNNSINNNNSADGGQQKQKNRICRDFVKGFCRRIYCRFPHVPSPDLVIFCHDYQNGSCGRINCKFLHYSIEEEEYYKTHGEFPPDAVIGAEEQQHMTMGGGGLAPPAMLPPPPPPLPHTVCTEFGMYGRCRHKDCYLMETGTVHRLVNPRERLSTVMWTNPSQMSNEYRDAVGFRIRDREYSELDRKHDEFLPLKRSAVAANIDGSDAVSPASPPLVPYKRDRLTYRDRDDIDVIAVIRRFEDEQNMLRKRVEANELKIAELRASNEYLMAQNAHMRLNNVQVSTVMSPVTHTTSQNAIIGGVSIAPVQVQATPIVSIATPQCSQIIAATSAAPIAIAATSQGQQLAISQQAITTLSNNTAQHLANAGHTQQILGTSQITLTPAALAQGLTINNTSQGATLSMSNANQPIISVPVMTHSILPH